MLGPATMIRLPRNRFYILPKLAPPCDFQKEAAEDRKLANFNAGLGLIQSAAVLTQLWLGYDTFLVCIPGICYNVYQAATYHERSAYFKKLAAIVSGCEQAPGGANHFARSKQ